ncbi:MAG TPA: hypothetical protein VGC34_07475 [Steroidobacteraceae bacterium]
MFTVGGEAVQGLLVGEVANPALHTQQLLDIGFVGFRDVPRNDLFLTVGQRLDVLEPAVDGRIVAVLRHQGRQSLHHAPDGAIELGLIARMNVILRTPAPLPGRA